MELFDKEKQAKYTAALAANAVTMKAGLELAGFHDGEIMTIVMMTVSMLDRELILKILAAAGEMKNDPQGFYKLCADEAADFYKKLFALLDEREKKAEKVKKHPIFTPENQ